MEGAGVVLAHIVFHWLTRTQKAHYDTREGLFGLTELWENEE